MRSWNAIGRVNALALYGFAALCHAQAGPQIEIDFVAAAAAAAVNVPLSSALPILIAMLVAALGIHALRRGRARGRLASWIVIGLAAVPLSYSVPHAGLAGDAHAALPTNPFPLTSSPAFTAVIENGLPYRATNATGGAIVLTAVKLVNISNMFLDTNLTTCTPGLTLAPGASCDVFLAS
jgi:hypothetical protein